MNRNSMCSCGSGRRYKHCCGNPADPAPRARDEALAAHRAGSLGRAEALYRRALDEHPQDIDSLHMLGVVQLQRLRYREALALLWDAAEETGWSVPQIRHNLGLTLGKLVTRDANARQTDLLTEFVALEQARRNSRANVAPLVTVVLPAYNHSRYVAQAIASVGAQTYQFKYEMMVAGRFQSVAAYLSLQAPTMKLEVPATLSRVVRTRRPGNWRDWFCPEDVAHYRPLLSTYMERYGYPDDWELSVRPAIRREECSEYVLRLVRERLGVPLLAGR